MNKVLHIFTLFVLLGSALLLTLTSHSTVSALIPSSKHKHRYILGGGGYAYYTVSKEDYIRHTLPYEWVPGWYDDTLRAGAVIIRSGVYWRVNRSVLGSPYPINNCYQTGSDSTLSYRTVPRSLGGQEEWRPDELAGDQGLRIQTLINDTYGYHAERLNQPPDRPDALVPLRYNSTIQTRTQWVPGVGPSSWQNRVQYAYIGDNHPELPYNPARECSTDAPQDPLDYSDPIFPNS